MPRKNGTHLSKSPTVVIYARVSTKEQEKEGFSIDAQLKLLREYAATNSFDVLQEYVDVETAKRAGRTGFTEMVGFFKKQMKSRTSADERHILLVEKTDRLYRNIKDWVTLDDIAIEIHLVKESVVLASDSNSSVKFMHGIRVLMAKNYIDNLGEETKKGMREKAEQGIYPSAAPIGYCNVAGSRDKRAIEPDPESAPIIQRLFEWYATGNYSLRDLTKKAYEDGLRSRTGTKMARSIFGKVTWEME